MNPETFDTVWDSTNDYSYSDLISFEDDNDAAALTDKVTAYVDGELIWGVEPDGTTPKTTDNTEDKTLYGDANCDGNVDISDAVLIKCFLINSKKYSLSAQGKKNADVQGNGNGINAQDAVAIQKYILKQIKALPVK